MLLRISLDIIIKKKHSKLWQTWNITLFILNSMGMPKRVWAERDRYLIYKGDESGFFETKGENIEQLRYSTSVAPGAVVGGEEGEDEQKAKAPLRNQFNFSERAAQTVNNSNRVSHPWLESDLWFRNVRQTRIHLPWESLVTPSINGPSLTHTWKILLKKKRLQKKSQKYDQICQCHLKH